MTYKSPFRSSLQKLADALNIKWLARPEDDVAGEIAGKVGGSQVTVPVGAVGDGLSDDTAAVQAALNKRGRVQGVPGKAYRVSNRLFLYDDTFVSDLTLVAAVGASECVFYLDGRFVEGGRANVTLERVRASCISAAAAPYLLRADVARNVTVTDCVLNNVLTVLTNPHLEYAQALDTLMCRNISVSVNTVSCDSLEPPAVVQLRYVRGGSITGNTLKGASHGVQWWGGDSNPTTGNGATGNTHYCSDILISGNSVQGVGAGGIWGSMGDRVSVVGNTLDTGGDVGIDFEGCHDCTATGNTVRNFHNGNLVTFFLSKGIVFAGNTSVQVAADRPHFRTYNVTNQPQNTSVSVNGNVFRTLGAISSVDTNSGCVGVLDFGGNTLENTVIAFDANNLHKVNVRGNSLRFDLQVGERPAISVSQFHGEYAQVDVVGNTLSTDVVQTGTVSAIRVTHDDFNSWGRVNIEGNRFVGTFGGADIEGVNTSGNAGVACVFTVRNNTVFKTSGAIRKTNGGARPEGAIYSIFANTDRNGQNADAGQSELTGRRRDERTIVIPVAGGAMAETFSIALPAGMFTRKPDVVHAISSVDNYTDGLTCTYLYDDPGSTKDQVKVVLRRAGGGNFTPGLIRLGFTAVGQ